MGVRMGCGQRKREEHWETPQEIMEHAEVWRRCVYSCVWMCVWGGASVPMSATSTCAAALQTKRCAAVTRGVTLGPREASCCCTTRLRGCTPLSACVRACVSRALDTLLLPETRAENLLLSQEKWSRSKTCCNGRGEIRRLVLLCCRASPRGWAVSTWVTFCVNA